MHVPLGSSFDAIVDVKNMDDWYNIVSSIIGTRILADVTFLRLP